MLVGLFRNVPIFIEWLGLASCVCVICYLLTATCAPKGHGSGLPLPTGQRWLSTYTHFPAQIKIADHSRAPPSPPPLTHLTKERGKASKGNKQRKKSRPLRPPERRKKGIYIFGGPGPPFPPSSPEPLTSSPSLSFERTRLVLMHPILVFLSTSNTASVDPSLHSHSIY